MFKMMYLQWYLFDARRESADSGEQTRRVEETRIGVHDFLRATAQAPEAVGDWVQAPRGPQGLEYEWSRVRSAIGWMNRHFPELDKVMPQRVAPLYLQRRIAGVCTHCRDANPEWFWRRNEALFRSDPDVRPGFFAPGLQCSGSCEALVVAWRDENERYGFQDDYVQFFHKETQASCDATAAQLREALQRTPRSQRP